MVSGLKTLLIKGVKSPRKKKKFFFAKFALLAGVFWYWYYYSHLLRYSFSPVCGIFYSNISLWITNFTQIFVSSSSFQHNLHGDTLTAMIDSIGYTLNSYFPVLKQDWPLEMYSFDICLYQSQNYAESRHIRREKNLGWNLILTTQIFALCFWCLYNHIFEQEKNLFFLLHKTWSW